MLEDCLLQAGAGQAEITPPVGMPLSGFIARENRPSLGIDTPLHVRALALRESEQTCFILSYELLGIGAGLEEQILSALEKSLGPVFARQRCAITAVHSHSGPPTGLLLGEAAPEPRYLDWLVEQSVAAAAQALAALRPAKLYIAERRLPGFTYNRRALLRDGRVSIAPLPDLPVVQRGPLDDRLTILLWRDLHGGSLATIAHYACHGVAVLSQNFGADIPGALAAGIEAQLGAPCLFLQGAAGDVNPTVVTDRKAGLRSWIDSAFVYLSNLQESFRPVDELPLKIVSGTLPLDFALLPSMEAAQRQVKDLHRIAQGELYSDDLQAAISAFKNTMNLPLDASLDPEKTRFVALALAKHADRVLAAACLCRSIPPLPLRISAWRIGSVIFVFVAGEVFTSTGLKIRETAKPLTVLPVSYLASLVGYLPDREALSLGGYEVDDAWRFYGQPAPFGVDSEPRLVEEIVRLVQELL